MPTSPDAPEPENSAENSAEPTAAEAGKNASPPYPNALRETRENKAMLSRAQLIQRCENLHINDGTMYVKVGMTTLHDLEAGIRKPRPNTANTIAAALGAEAADVFPGGYDTAIRHGAGNPNLATGVVRSGRPRKKKQL